MLEAHLISMGRSAVYVVEAFVLLWISSNGPRDGMAKPNPALHPPHTLATYHIKIRVSSARRRD